MCLWNKYVLTYSNTLYIGTLTIYVSVYACFFFFFIEQQQQQQKQKWNAVNTLRNCRDYELKKFFFNL